jgi:prepilin-type N-terminal cleavage/methylation domain-containing protein
MKKTAFTLIELLVVIVIIGILATIGVASFSGYMVKARDAERETVVSTVTGIILQNAVLAETDGSEKYCFFSDAGISSYCSSAGSLTDFLRTYGYTLPNAKDDICYFYSYIPANNSSYIGSGVGTDYEQFVFASWNVSEERLVIGGTPNYVDYMSTGTRLPEENLTCTGTSTESSSGRLGIDIMLSGSAITAMNFKFD